MAKPKFPMVVKRGHTTVKIYLTPTKGCESFTVVHYLGEKRQRKTFADLEAAVTEAEVIATKLSAGDPDRLCTLTPHLAGSRRNAARARACTVRGAGGWGRMCVSAHASKCCAVG